MSKSTTVLIEVKMGRLNYSYFILVFKNFFLFLAMFLNGILTFLQPSKFYC